MRHKPRRPMNTCCGDSACSSRCCGDFVNDTRKEAPQNTRTAEKPASGRGRGNVNSESVVGQNPAVMAGRPTPCTSHFRTPTAPCLGPIDCTLSMCTRWSVQNPRNCTVWVVNLNLLLTSCARLRCALSPDLKLKVTQEVKARVGVIKTQATDEIRKLKGRGKSLKKANWDEVLKKTNRKFRALERKYGVPVKRITYAMLNRYVKGTRSTLRQPGRQPVLLAHEAKAVCEAVLKSNLKSVAPSYFFAACLPFTSPPHMARQFRVLNSVPTEESHRGDCGNVGVDPAGVVIRGKVGCKTAKKTMKGYWCETNETKARVRAMENPLSAALPGHPLHQ